MSHSLPPIRKVFSIIDSCTNEDQLESCENIAHHYTQMAIRKGIVNPELISEMLEIKIKEKRSEFELVNHFNHNEVRHFEIGEFEEILAEELMS